MNKKIIIFIFSVVLIIAFIWIYQVYKTKNVKNITTSTTQLIGGDKDSHGCLIGAGYQWCVSQQACQRLWEGRCDPDFIKTVTFVDTKDGLVIYYEEPGKPALTKSFIFDSKCTVNNQLCESLDIPNGSVGKVKGITLDGYILITSLTF